MNNNSKLHKSSSIFLAAVLVAGVIAIASPSLAFAEGSDRYEKKHNSHDYKENKAVCKVGNVFINAAEQFQGAFETELAGMLSQAGTESTDGMNAQDGGTNGFNGNSNGGGDALIDINRNILNVCANFLNDNEVGIALVQDQTTD